MIVLLIALWSLCAVYFTHLFYQKKMKIAAIASTVLYVNVIAWTYMIFILDVANLGFKESGAASIIGSDVFHSFTKLRDLFTFLPEEIHVATAFAAIAVAAAVVLELVVSGIRIYKEIVLILKKVKHIFKNAKRIIVSKKETVFYDNKIYLLHCRLNN